MRIGWLALAAISSVATAADVRQLFSERCAICHAEDASGSDRGPALAMSRRLRARPAAEIREIIRKGTPGGMPAFTLPDVDLDSLAGFIRSMNASALDAQPPGDVAEGERFFFGRGQCGSCHIVKG